MLKAVILIKVNSKYIGLTGISSLIYTLQIALSLFCEADFKTATLNPLSRDQVPLSLVELLSHHVYDCTEHLLPHINIYKRDIPNVKVISSDLLKDPFL